MDRSVLKTCRVCLNSRASAKMFPLADENTRKWFQECTSLELRDGNPMVPQQLCTDCYLKCLTCYRFRKQAMESDATFTNKVEMTPEDCNFGMTPAIELLLMDPATDEDVPADEEEENDDGEVVMEEGEGEKCDDSFLIEYVQLPAEEDIFLPEETLPASPSPPPLPRPPPPTMTIPQPAMMMKTAKANVVKPKKEASDDPLECPTCSKTFKCPSYLERHKVTHISERPFVCDDCGSSFTREIHLKQHKMIHSDERPFVCQICSKAFKYRSVLDKHLLIHSGERPFKCEDCGKCFLGRHPLQRHQLIHTGERPYKCDICGKSFNQRTTLVVHSRLHSGERPYYCSICDATFTQKAPVVNHMRKYHGVVGVANTE